MAKNGIQHLKRREGFRAPERLYVIVTEGETEENYFNMIKRHKLNNMRIICKKGKHPDVRNIIKSADHYLQKERLEDNEHATCWLVLDIDRLTHETKRSLQSWKGEGAKSGSRNPGISSPEFEYWLLLHYELPKRNLTKQQCKNDLKSHITDYEKPYKNCVKMWELIPTAIDNARHRTITLDSNQAGTNLHLLAEKLLETS